MNKNVSGSFQIENVAHEIPIPIRQERNSSDRLPDIFHPAVRSYCGTTTFPSSSPGNWGNHDMSHPEPVHCRGTIFPQSPSGQG